MPAGPPGRTPLVELGWLFLELGTVGFGGPVAHVAIPDLATAVVGASALLLLARHGVDSAWLIAGSAPAGVLLAR